MGQQKRFSCDNDEEFTGQIIDLWVYTYKVTLGFSRPGTPTDNPHITSFNGTLLDEFLNANCFSSVMAVRRLTEAWRLNYNDNQPHMAHNRETSTEFDNYQGCAIVLRLKLPLDLNILPGSTKPSTSLTRWLCYERSVNQRVTTPPPTTLY